MTPATTFVALGANLDDPVAQVTAAFDELAALPRTRLLQRSSLYRSVPVGYHEQPDFINAVAQLETALTPRAVLDALLVIEQRHGRVRTFRNAPRTLDLDLLLYDDWQYHESGLTLPHPLMHERAFVLAPLAEIAPQAQIPNHGTVTDLLRALDSGGVARLAEAPSLP